MSPVTTPAPPSFRSPTEFSSDEGLTVKGDGASVEFFALDGNDQPMKDALSSYNVQVARDANGRYVASVSLARALPSGRAFFLVRYDAAKLSPAEFKVVDALTGSALSLVVLGQPGYAPVGVATIGAKPAPLPAGEICTLSFEPHPASGRKVSSAPMGPDNVPANIVVTAKPNGDVTIDFNERNVGDYDFSGEVGISDLAPVAQYYAVVTTSKTEIDPEYWVDGDRNGEVGITDLTPIAQNYGTKLMGYNVYRDGMAKALLNPGETNPDTPTKPSVLRPTVDELRSHLPPIPTALPFPYEYLDHPSHVARTIVYTLKAVAPVPYPNIGMEEGVSVDVPPLDYLGDVIPPLAPQGLVATAGNSHVSLTWTATIDTDLAGYDVYSSTTPSDPAPAKVNASLLTATALDVTSLTNGTTYYFRVTATDNNVPPNTGNYSTEVSATPINQLPTASAHADVAYGPIPLTVNFDAAGSTDPDGTIATYEWDLDGDGTYEVSNATGDAQLVYKTIGTTTVSLRVTDNQGGQCALPATLVITRVSRFAFTSNISGVTQVYIINSDGTSRTQVTAAVSDIHGFNFSPDGAKIVFWCTNGGGSDNISIIGVDGTGVQQLTNSSGGNGDAVFSPDNSTIAFVSNRDGDPEIYKMNADGTNQTNITNMHGGGMTKIGDLAPAWSPDGTRIAFVSDRSGSSNIWAMNPDGSSLANLTGTSGPQNGNPKWSADGQWVYFNTNRDANYEIYKMGPLGGSLEDVTNSSRDEKDFDLAGDLSMMVLESNRLGTGVYFNIYSEILSTGQLWQLSADLDKNNYRPRLSPDGTRVVFVTNEISKQNVRVMWTDGSHKTWITSDLFWNDAVAWQPVNLN